MNKPVGRLNLGPKNQLKIESTIDPRTKKYM